MVQTVLADCHYKHVSGYVHPNLEKLALSNPRLLTARNTYTSLQVLIRPDESALLTTTNENLLRWSGHTYRIRMATEIEGGIQIQPLMVGLVLDDDHVEKADPLLRTENSWIEKGEVQAVWLRIYIPAEISPATYHGKVRFFYQFGFGDEKELASQPFEIEVRETILAPPKEWQFYLDLWQHTSAVARWHKVRLWSEEHFHLLDHYLASLAALGQKAVTVIAGEIPWSGQRCFRDTYYPTNLFEHSMVRLIRDKNGKWRLDCSPMDRYIESAFSKGIDAEIEVFGLLNIWQDQEYGFEKVIPDGLDGWRIRYLDEADGCMKYLRTSEEFANYLRMLYSHFDSKAWIDKIRIAADEPREDSGFTERVAFVKKNGPKFKFKVACNSFAMFEKVDPAVVDWTPNIGITSQNPELTRSVIANASGRICFYVCCGPDRPNTFIRSPLIEAHLIPWLVHYFGLDGFLRWAFHLWPDKPWERISWRAPHWSAGDMGFTYPGRDGRPIETVRYEIFRQGIQDAELINLLKKKNKEIVETVLQQVFKGIIRAEKMSDFASTNARSAESLYSLDPRDYTEARRLVLDALEGKK